MLFKLIEGRVPTSKLEITAARLVRRFNENKKLKVKKNNLSERDLHILREVTIRETPPEVVEKRWERIKREVEVM